MVGVDEAGHDDTVRSIEPIAGGLAAALDDVVDDATVAYEVDAPQLAMARPHQLGPCHLHTAIVLRPH